MKFDKSVLDKMSEEEAKNVAWSLFCELAEKGKLLSDVSLELRKIMDSIDKFLF